MVDHLDDIESDLSAIHRIDDMWAMEAGKFFRFAYRLPAYKGAMRTVAERQAMEEDRNGGGKRREAVPVAAGELHTIDGLAEVTRDAGDGAVWLSIEKATDTPTE